MSRSDVGVDTSQTMALNILVEAVQDEDTAHASGDKGIVLLAVRKDTATALAGTDADYIPLTTDSTGRLRVAALAANSGTDIGDVDVTSLPADAFAADAQAYGKGVMIQGDDGTDRRALLVGTDGHLQVDVLSGGGGGGAATIADGADIAQGALADAAVSTDASGSLSAKLRGIIKLLVDQITVKIASGTVTTVGTLSAITAGETHIGQTTGAGISISVTPTITAGGIYAAKEAVGGEMTFANAVRANAGSGIINSVTIADNDGENAGLELWLFSATVAEAADNAAMDFTDAELLTCVGVIPISTADYFPIADNSVACLRGVGLQFKCAATSLFGQLKATGTPTYTAVGDLTVTLGIEYLN